MRAHWASFRHVPSRQPALRRRPPPGYLRKGRCTRRHRGAYGRLIEGRADRLTNQMLVNSGTRRRKSRLWICTENHEAATQSLSCHLLTRSVKYTQQVHLAGKETRLKTASSKGGKSETTLRSHRRPRRPKPKLTQAKPKSGRPGMLTLLPQPKDSRSPAACRAVPPGFAVLCVGPPKGESRMSNLKSSAARTCSLPKSEHAASRS